jgi:hypothetical protein
LLDDHHRWPLRVMHHRKLAAILRGLPQSQRLQAAATVRARGNGGNFDTIKDVRTADVRSSPTSATKSARSGSDGPSYWQSRFSVTLKPPVAILLPGAHSHMVLDHGRRVVPGRPRLLVFFNGHLGLFDLPCLRQGRG